MSAQYSVTMLAQLAGVDAARIRRWQRRGWLVPAVQEHRLALFDFQEVTLARKLAELHRSGIKPALLARKLAEIERRYPHIQRPLVELGIVVEGRQLLVREGADLVEPSGQHRIDFAALEDDAADDAVPATIVTPAVFLARGAGVPTAPPAQLAEWAAQLDEAGDLAAAGEMYRAALAAGGPDPELCFQLADLLYRLGELSAARERYYQALELDENFLEARANLGCVLAELGQLDLAVAAFEGTLAAHETYADVHYHLARTLDDQNRADDASLHWRRYLELAPDSPWAAEARDRLSS
jgi:tetratricopeptide (TPR) repeat protein